MGVLRGYLRFRVVVVLAVSMAAVALVVLTSTGDLTGLLLLGVLMVASFAVVAVLLALR